MEQISLYLTKFKGLVPKESTVQECAAPILSRYIEAPVIPATIRLKGNTVYINASPSVKNILFMHKENILKELHEKLVRISIKDMR